MSSLLQIPASAHTRPPPGSLSYAEGQLDQDFNGKVFLNTTTGVKREWRTGSKRRVVKYYAIYIGIGIIVGGIIGMIVGLAIRYS